MTSTFIVSGALLAGYGGRMPDGRSSSGVLIGAAAGTPVRAVADGTVVFAEWMTGYGMILIVDHGNGAMSLYAHCETLLKEPGTAVKRGARGEEVRNDTRREARQPERRSHLLRERIRRADERGRRIEHATHRVDVVLKAIAGEGLDQPRQRRDLAGFAREHLGHASIPCPRHRTV